MATIDQLRSRLESGWDEIDHGRSAKQDLWRSLLSLAATLGADKADWRLLRAPGRVNLIGEHTDYNGLPVMPAALDREVMMVFRPLPGGRVRVVNLEAAFGEREFQASAEIPPHSAGDWANYVKAAAQALVLWARGRGLEADCGFEAALTADIPGGAGLSSSSALVVACGLAFANANALDIPRREMADLMAAGERYVGTQGGGMDQTACLMGEAHKAIRIEFNPTRVSPCPLPDGTAVIVANTLVRAEKSAAMRENYNRRSAECRLASALVRKATGLDVKLLADLFGHEEAPMDILTRSVHSGGYTLQELGQALGTSADGVVEQFLLQKGAAPIAQPEEGFQPFRRAAHVVTEAIRVREAGAAMEAGDARRVGELMNASHASCRDDFGISCPELDALVEIAQSAGALGARLTGAGFGGCIVALAPQEKVDAVMEAIRARYYGAWLKENRPELAKAVEGPEDRRLFSFVPQAGASVHT